MLYILIKERRMKMEDNVDNIKLKFLYIETSGSNGMTPSVR